MVAHLGTVRVCLHSHGAETREGGYTYLTLVTPRLSLYKKVFHFKALLWEAIILVLPYPHLQRPPYCNTIARPLRNIRPATDPPFVCHTPYYIGDGNIV